MDDNDELDTIVMQDEDKTLDTKSDEVKEEDDQELIIIPFKETCSKHIRGFRRHSCLYKYRLICAWQQDSRQTCTCGSRYRIGLITCADIHTKPFTVWLGIDLSLILFYDLVLI